MTAISLGAPRRVAVRPRPRRWAAARRRLRRRRTPSRPTSTPASRPSSTCAPAATRWPTPARRRRTSARASTTRSGPRARRGIERRPVRRACRALDPHRPGADAARPGEGPGRDQRRRLHRRRSPGSTRRAPVYPATTPEVPNPPRQDQELAGRARVLGRLRGRGRHGRLAGPRPRARRGVRRGGRARSWLTATAARHLDAHPGAPARARRRGARGGARPRRPASIAPCAAAGPGRARAAGRAGEQREPAGRARRPGGVPGGRLGRRDAR